MSQAEPGWEQHPRIPDAFTRPLIGMELWLDQDACLKDGMNQLAIGVEFTSATHEHDLQHRLKEAVVRLRFECPLVAATMEQGLHHPEFRSWVYAPVMNITAARAWAANVVHYVPNPVQDPTLFLQSTVENHKLPYFLDDNIEQYFRVYLTRPNCSLNAYFLSLHSSHSIIDARPGMNVLSLLLEWMTTPDLPNVDELAWGTEYKNLPPGPVTVTGGPREDWNTKGKALVERCMSSFGDPVPSHGLQCDTSRASGLLKAHRLLVKFTAEESANIARALKTLGFTFSELLDAAVAVAMFDHNPVPADKIESACVRTGSPIAITDRLPPSVDRRKHVVSCLTLAPYRIYYAPLSSALEGKARLLAAMRQRQEQYTWWLANPCLPHLLAELAPRIVPTAANISQTATSRTPGKKSTYVPAVTNIGRVENYISTMWPQNTGPRVGMVSQTGCRGPGEAIAGAVSANRGISIRVDEMHLACRMGNGMFAPLVHAWSMQGRLSVLLQAASDVWDKDVLQEFMSRIVRQLSFVVA